MNKQALIDAIKQSGGKQNALDETNVLWARIDYLQKAGRYKQLLSQLTNANDKSNFLALVLEANFAFQFESQGLELTYEVRQDAQQKSSIDFLRKMPTGDSVFFELRLLQQAKAVTSSINAQLPKCNVYRIAMDGQGEQDEIFRIQNTVLSKVQDKNGRPIKFLSTVADAVNIVVVDATDNILGAIDVFDCKLATYGDPGVEEIHRREVFGLFQADRHEYPQHIHDLAVKYSHIRSMLHGVLFLFKKPDTGILAYQLEQYLMWNSALIGTEKAGPIYKEITNAIPLRAVRI